MEEKLGAGLWDRGGVQTALGSRKSYSPTIHGLTLAIAPHAEPKVASCT